MADAEDVTKLAVDVGVLRERVSHVVDTQDALMDKIDLLIAKCDDHALKQATTATAIEHRLDALEELAGATKAAAKVALKKALPVLAILLGAAAMGGETVAKAINLALSAQ